MNQKQTKQKTTNLPLIKKTDHKQKTTQQKTTMFLPLSQKNVFVNKMLNAKKPRSQRMFSRMKNPVFIALLKINEKLRFIYVKIVCA
jgi:hypothetical protein